MGGLHHHSGPSGQARQVVKLSGDVRQAVIDQHRFEVSDPAECLAAGLDETGFVGGVDTRLQQIEIAAHRIENLFRLRLVVARDRGDDRAPSGVQNRLGALDSASQSAPALGT